MILVVAPCSQCRPATTRAMIPHPLFMSVPSADDARGQVVTLDRSCARPDTSPACNSPGGFRGGRRDGERPLLTSSGSKTAREAARVIHGVDEREPSKGYNVPRSHNALGYRMLETIRGPDGKVKGLRCRYLRQREYPQPPPPSTNNTTRTINRVSMFLTSPHFFPGVSDSCLLAGSSSSGSLPPL